ncbi:FAS1-like dehydratase domain-containing protein [Cryptosporangium japonicum]|uniref:MaoC family dehydratase N-terminal domain-containing protein n=1 Tax=Cryptosporangium japonicum TaxID=80872 RepID=A0ABN0UZL8_9ACTN
MIVRTAVLDLAPAARFAGTFAPGVPVEPGAVLPPAWEGLYFPFDASLAALRADGSPADDGLTPPDAPPRRMYAGEDTEFHHPLRWGDTVEQRSSLTSVTRKEGRSGSLLFADITREYLVDGAVAVRSVWHDVFLSGGAPPVPATGETPDGDWAAALSVDIRQLFRFSAITFNTHRVHYDRDWALEVERLPGLLVHGPLVRILLLDALRAARPGLAVTHWSIRSHAPVLVDAALCVVGRGRDVELYEGGHLLARGHYRSS